LGCKEQALEHLQQAVKFGFTDLSGLTTDDDLKPLHSDPRFQALVNEVQKRQASK